MATKKLKFEDFDIEKISKNQQKTIKGGDGEDIDPNKLKGLGNP
ncbi:rSAM-modified peptide [Flavobacterium sp. MMLR14_040]|nr:rSAM-modified peptide [Flavobacterium sp. MMLR14_040]MDW8849784.1 rSAM-modified peptide [Flavobacterium sp. MMLR14_040]